MRTHVRVVLLGVIAIVSTLSGCERGGGAGPSADAALPPDLVHAWVVVPNLDSLLDHASAVSNAFEPGSAPPGRLRAQLGMVLEESALDSLATDKPIVVMVLAADPKAPVGPPPVACILPAKNPKALESTVQREMGLVSSLVEDLLVVAADGGTLARATPLAAGYEETLAKIAWTHDLHARMNLAGLNQTYGPMIQGGVSTILALAEQGLAAGQQAGMDRNAIAKILRLELKMLTGMLNQSKSLGLGLAMDANAIHIDYDYAAQEGSAMAQFLSTPPETPSKVAALVEPGAMCGMYYRIDPRACAAAADRVLVEAADDPDIAPFVEECRVLAKEWLEVVGGECAMSMGSSPEKMFEMRGAYTVTDPERILAVMANWTKAFGPEGSIGRVYTELGIPMKVGFEKNVRGHDGVAVHRMNMGIDTSALPLEQQEIYRQMPMAYELAVVDNVALLAANAGQMNPLIAKAKQGETGSKLPLRAATVFGSDMDLYMDCDLVGFMRIGLATLPPGVGREVFDNLGPPSPMIWAATIEKGTTHGRVEVPLGPFAKLSEGFRRKAQPERMPQRTGR